MAGKTPRKPVKAATRPDAAGTVLLSGGNPQITKGYGDAPVRAYIAAMPGWKNDVGRCLDAIIERTVPGVGRRSNGTHHSTASRARAGSCRFTSSPVTSK